ncbi:hypothetical protein BDY21DRAFT_282680 [Lineolata rhizophorae]|uniref:Glucose-methanol-choline oxidoreductase N-terminal domain-containing protein n=1 Tax=Lineolata rhizophorae TaxID=578093 RepID=A0A6A6P4M5_9PEZI|nr:hypothetical protein BDY21DRAFT_282680 [Lineolata rhizophorae]
MAPRVPPTKSTPTNVKQPATAGYPVPPLNAHKLPSKALKSATQAKKPKKAPDSTGKRFPRISRPVELLRATYDTVVIGSGYGGGVAASRMARGGQSVCVLELGKERWPGEYPSSLSDAAPEIHISGDFAPKDERSKPVDRGNKTGLYHFILGAGQNAFVGNGLGGTSLLNANIFLKADHKTMAQQDWPDELMEPGSLDEYYEKAAAMLEPSPYPRDFPELNKLKVLEKQAESMNLGEKFYRPPQTTKFQDGPNSTGVHMQASTLTGQDCTGVNDGSKITTLVTYLADAWNWGAEIFCECEVRYIKKHPKEGYLVFFAWHGAKRPEFEELFESDLMWVHAKKFVFVGAGTIGTTEIMLRSKQLGLPMSNRVGQDMSGNGDILAFGYNLNENVNSLGRDSPLPDHPIGPTITGVIDCRDQKDPLDGFVVEEGAVPSALAFGLQPLLELLPGEESEDDTIADRVRRHAAKLGSVAFGPYYQKGAVERTQIYLIMSHDSNQAVLTLKDNKPSLEFMGVGRTEHLQTLNKFMAELTHNLGGEFVNNPFYAALNQQQITVHPIGGMNLSSDGTADEGVTTHFGEVLTGDGTEFHDGLVVVDGALLPTALGVNPFATITALAERCVEGVAKKKGIEIDYTTRNGVLDMFGYPEHPIPKDQQLIEAEDMISKSLATGEGGIAFTEVMKGFIHVGDDIQDFKVAAEHAKGECADARFFLSVRAYDTDTFVSQSDHRAQLTGTFSNGMPGSPFMVLRGDFQLFNKDTKTPDTASMTYDFDMVGTNGDVIHFHGEKHINPSISFSPTRTWEATATLYVTLSWPDGSLVGKGVLEIGMRDFIDQMQTLTAYGRNDLVQLRSKLKFFSYFKDQVAKSFFSPLHVLQYPSPPVIGEEEKGKKAPNKTFKVLSKDGIESTMHMWEPTTTSTPGLTIVNILWVPGAAVDQQIFALPTIKKNAIEYFTAAGYRCWSVTHRTGRSPAAQDGWTSFDARLDIQAALVAIREATSEDKVYIIAHCAGSVALSIGLLDGTINPEWIIGITASNVFLHPEFARVNYLKARVPLITQAYSAFSNSSFFNSASTREDSLFQRALNQALRLYPVGYRDEICNSVVCHRCSLVFGKLWSHRNLNEATHSQLDRFTGGVSIKNLRHLMKMGVKGRVLDADAKDTLFTDANLERLRNIPIFFLSGVENTVYAPEATLTSYVMLRRLFGEKGYERVEFIGRGHLDCWMGAEEAGHGGVYELVRKKMERVIVMGKEGLRGPQGRIDKPEEDGAAGATATNGSISA